MSAKGTDSSSSEDLDDALRNQLLKLRQQLIKDTERELSSYIKGDDRQSIEDVLDTGDWSVFELNDTLKQKALESHRQSIIKLDDSIQKLDEGTYGVCDDCDEAISAGRLKVLPFATRCRDCQEDFEESDASDQSTATFKL